ncbi:MAG: fused MFS/spermidine synthase [Candidatus Dormibacteraeota bacterium]|uniref:Fused MFS/spermidine synthase n=1 Tax=Candidatus Aeolococcus gillhamiae TaxID=3127015 RepID=A0A934JZS2_9BACT|nr:fused MFS/spermidine synthase [Candidatus Dormibacteraeota bacterium]
MGEPPLTPVPRFLPFVVFAAGAGSLATEICASRLLAPYFGNTTVVWANVIGLILVYLSVGYWLGGRVADRHPHPRVLGGLLLVAAVAISVLPFIAHPFLQLALQGFSALSIGVVAGSFFATLLLFSVPVSLLGMVSPFAVRLAVRDVQTAGSVSGRLSSLTTIGAIAGTFVPALLLIPAIGTQRTLLCAALLVSLAAFPLLPRRAPIVSVVVAGLLLIPPATVKPVAGAVLERETQYEYVQVVTTPDGRTALRLDDGIADQSVYRPNTVLTGSEWDMPLVVPPLLDRPLRRVLVIGNAGGTMARSLAHEYPGVQIDGVEPDPAVSDIGRQLMGMADVPGLHVVEADGRAFLATTPARYDLIVVDAYRQAYVPFWLVTQEFFALARAHLNGGGAIAFNMARVPGDDRLAQAVSGTLATVFPDARIWPALSFNELVVGFDHTVSPSALQTRLQQLPRDLRVLIPLVSSQLHAVAPVADPLTDDHAPVEWLTDRALLEEIAAGGHFTEELLPTHP